MVTYGPWVQPDDVTRLEASWAAAVTIERATLATATVPTPDGATFNSVMAEAWNSHGAVESVMLSGGQVDCHVYGSGGGYDLGLPTEYWKYQAGAYSGSSSIVSWSGSLVMPGTSFSEGMFPLPAGAIGVELASTEGEILSCTVDYTLTEQSYDASATGSNTTAASGSWTSTLTLGASGASVVGPGVPGAVIGSGSVPVTYGTEIPASGDLSFSSIAVSDPRFPASDVLVGGLWDLTARLVLKPPLIRYIYPVPKRQAPLRIVQRGSDGLGMTGGRRIFQNRTIQSTNRRGAAIR